MLSLMHLSHISILLHELIIVMDVLQLGVMLNSIKRLLDTLRPKIEAQMKAWAECLPEGAGHGGAVFGERHNEVTIELRAKYKNFLQAIVEKLAENVSSMSGL